MYIVKSVGLKIMNKECYMCGNIILITLKEQFYVLTALNFNNKYRKTKELPNDIFICKKCFEKTKMYKKMTKGEEKT